MNETHSQSLLRANRPTGKQELSRPIGAHYARKKKAAPPVGPEADLHEALYKGAFSRAQANIAGECQVGAASGSRSVDRRHGRLRVVDQSTNDVARSVQDA